MLVIALLAVIAIGSGWWLPWDPAAIDLQQRLLPPGAAHWLGTDHLGRDIFSRLLAATRVSLGAVMACLLLVLLIGLAVGGCAICCACRVRRVRGGWKRCCWPSTSLHRCSISARRSSAADSCSASAWHAPWRYGRSC
ncbi:unnamed protein product [Klebsiella pneumoniae subsp. rhinoscleromatis SB3432]|nr:unnamed protein product [Klebsiella pneumoniae subsp. rhinoscleromatis SB3432]